MNDNIKEQYREERMKGLILIPVVNPNRRRYKRAMQKEVEFLMMKYVKIEEEFLKLLFDDDIPDEDYVYLYKRYFNKWADLTRELVAKKKFKYTRPNTRYFYNTYGAQEKK